MSRSSQLLDPTNPLLASPNKITSADFDGWFEERATASSDQWDPGYTALTETAIRSGPQPEGSSSRIRRELIICCVRALPPVP